MLTIKLTLHVVSRLCSQGSFENTCSLKVKIEAINKMEKNYFLQSFIDPHEFGEN